MQKKAMTLKSMSRKPKTTLPAVQETTTTIIAGQSNKGKAQSSCSTVIDRLHELILTQQKVFIQMRNGAGYCGIPTQVKDGWLKMTDVSIHGTKQTISSQSILIQFRDGSFIAHLHAVDSYYKIGV